MPRYISVTEKSIFLNCPKYHYWGYDRKLLPKGVTVDTPLTIGSLGHLVMRDYALSGFSSGFNIKESLSKNNRNHGLVTMPVEKTLYFILESYIGRTNYLDKNKEVLGVELELTAKVPDTNITLVGHIDLLYKTGNKTIFRDYKFVTEYSNEDLVSIDPQMLSYAWLLEQNGYEVDYIEYDMIKKKTEPMPVLSRNGMLDKRVVCSYERALAFIRSNGLSEEANEDYLEKLRSKKNMFSKRLLVSTITSQASKEQFIKNLVSEVQTIESVGHKFPKVTYQCPRCPYFSLCLNEMNSGNAESVISKDFIERTKGVYIYAD